MVFWRLLKRGKDQEAPGSPGGDGSDAASGSARREPTLPDTPGGLPGVDEFNETDALLLRGAGPHCADTPPGTGQDAAPPETAGAERADRPPPAMYEGFYQLDGLPFLTVPDPRFIYWSEGHELAFSVLRYGLMTRAPITVITGEVGAGKTTLLRQLLTEIPEDLSVGLISNMQAGRGELLHWVMMAFDLPFTGDEPHVVLFRRFQDFVVEAYGSGRRVMLIVDEAQNLSPGLLEELRLLSNINADGDELLQLILVGQPDLRDLIGRPELRQFAQRICADFNLMPLSAEETVRYINTRLDRVGARWTIFPDPVCEMICRATRGIPRLINVLCDLCLVNGFAEERKVIDTELLRDILGSARNRGLFSQFDTSLTEVGADAGREPGTGTGIAPGTGPGAESGAEPEPDGEPDPEEAPVPLPEPGKKAGQRTKPLFRVAKGGGSAAGSGSRKGS